MTKKVTQKVRQKISYPQIILYLESIMKEAFSDKEHALDFNYLDFKSLLDRLAQDTKNSNEELLKQGFRRAYRQLVEGV